METQFVCQTRMMIQPPPPPKKKMCARVAVRGASSRDRKQPAAADLGTWTTGE